MASLKPSSYGTAPEAASSRILSVARNSPAARAGIGPGESVIAANGILLRDTIDWQWNADGRAVTIALSDTFGDQRDVTLEREPGESWGIEFVDPVFDAVRVCANNCTFCFMSQLPQGLRSSLYLRDDDFRLSFIHGNFVTLTNLDADDVARILEQHLSPLYVSLHAVDPEVRSSLLCPRKDDGALEIMDALIAGGITLHTQVVLVPGVNDGRILEETLEWCGARRNVHSVGIVPVGRTRLAPAEAPSFVDHARVAGFVEKIRPTIERMSSEREPGWLQIADEFYLGARADIPSAAAYGSFSQLGNGIGMVRDFVDSFATTMEAHALERPTEPRRAVTLLTGELFAPVLRELCALHDLGNVEVLPVANGLFGGGVNVAGLLSGRDILDAAARGLSAPVAVIPSTMFNSEGLTLDDMTLTKLQDAVGDELTLVSCVPEALPDALIALSVEA